jgi:uncharacterized membrane protein
METKTLSLFLATLIILSLAVVSAGVTLNPTSITLSENTLTQEVNISNNHVTDTVSSLEQTMAIADVIVTVEAYNIAAGSSELVNVSVTQSEIEDLEVTATGSVTIEDATLTVVLQGEYCTESNPHNNIKLTIEDISVESGFGDDEDYWYPLDEIEIELEVENNGNDDLDNVEIEWVLYDEEGNEIMDGDESDFDLDDDDTESVIITLKIDPDDLDQDMSDYVFIARATGEDTEHNDDNICDSASETVEARIESFVILDDMQVTGTTACGSNTMLTLDAWNIDDADLDDDEVYIRVYSEELGINEVIEFDKGIDSFDKETVSIELDIPNNVEEGWYGIELIVFEDEDLDDSDIFENSEDDEAIFTKLVNIAGNCVGSENQEVEMEIALSEATPTARAGKTVVIVTTLENTGASLAEYAVSVTGTSAWATASINPQTARVLPGSSEQVEIALEIDSDATLGEKEFTITVDYAEGSESQTVAIDVEKGFSLSQHFKDNWFIYTVIIIDIILIVAIVVAIGRIVSKKSA